MEKTPELYRYAVEAEGKQFIETAPSKYLLEQNLRLDFKSFKLSAMGSDETLLHAVARLGW